MRLCLSLNLNHLISSFLFIFSACFDPCPTSRSFVSVQRNQAEGERRGTARGDTAASSFHIFTFLFSPHQKLLPDPILKLSRIIGFGGATTKCVRIIISFRPTSHVHLIPPDRVIPVTVLPQALWTKSGDAVVYPCHAIIVSMKISSSQQRFFLGHTDKVNELGCCCYCCAALASGNVILPGDQTQSKTCHLEFFYVLCRFPLWLSTATQQSWPQHKLETRASCDCGTTAEEAV